AGQVANGLSDGSRDRNHLHVHGRDAVVHQNDDARKISLRKERDRQTKQEDQPRQRKTQEDQDQRASVRVNEIGQARCHFSFSSFPFPSFSFSSFLFSSLLRTCVPSGRL